jgi:hypothetical protein
MNSHAIGNSTKGATIKRTATSTPAARAPSSVASGTLTLAAARCMIADRVPLAMKRQAPRNSPAAITSHVSDASPNWNGLWLTGPRSQKRDAVRTARER